MPERSSPKYKQQVGVYVNVFRSGSFPQRNDQSKCVVCGRSRSRRSGSERPASTVLIQQPKWMHIAFIRTLFQNLVSEPFYSKLSNPRCPHTPNEYTLEMRVDVERLRMEIVLSQPAPPTQCDPSPRRLPAVDTESEEPGTPRRSPAIGTGSDEPGVLRADTQLTGREESFNDWGGGGDVTHLSPFWEGTARK